MNLQKFTGLLLVTIFLTSLVQAAPKKGVQGKNLPKLTEVTLKKVNGEVKWTGYGVGKSHTGTIGIKSGEIKLSGDVIVAANFVLDMKTLNTGDSDKLKAHLRSEDFFDVEKFSEANFKSTQVEVVKDDNSKLGETFYHVVGDLTIKGKTEPVMLMAHVSKDGQKFSAVADAEIKDRTKYGIAYHSKQFETISKLGDKLIEDNIKIEIKVQAQP